MDRIPMKDDVEITTNSINYNTGINKQFSVAISDFFLKANIRAGVAEIIQNLVKQYLTERQNEIYRIVDDYILKNREVIEQLIKDEITRVSNKVISEIFKEK